MHPLHNYVAKHLADKLKNKKVVVWYDERGEFASFITEVRGGPRTTNQAVPVSMAGIATHLAEYAGSMYELRAVVESRVSGDTPESVVIYLRGCERDRLASVLMELEKAGECIEPQLKRLARNVLRQRYTDGVIDELLAPELVTYEDLARAASDSSSAEPPSILKSIFHDASGNDGLLAAWLVSDARDADIAAKEATRELGKLIRSRLGLELPEGTALAKLRAITLRYVLAGEFRSDLQCPPPACLAGIATPKTKEEETALRDLVRRLRTGFGESYASLADRVEEELGLRNAKLPPGALGAIDTFRFEERSLLTHCGELIANQKFDEALGLVRAREQSFWLDRDVGRKAQWEACRRMAKLGSIAISVRSAVNKTKGDANAWVDAYTDQDGWHRIDQAQRHLEVWLNNPELDADVDEKALGVARRVYEDTVQLMAEGFSSALGKASWTISKSLHQTRIFGEVVTERPKPVAYFLVDAMRFEMGVELARRLPKTSEVSVKHAVCALPSITPIGMAALQPGASSSFNVIEQGGKLGARIGDAFLPDLPARKKLAAARIPKLVDITLDDLLNRQPSMLAKAIDGAQVVMVRSQEIDHAGEAGFTSLSPKVMDAVIDNIAGAIRRLAAAGIEHVVISADHGHLLFAADRDVSMRTDAPGGHTVELHRRCWIGRGGATPPGCVRVAASALGYASDLEFVFPTGSGVFKAGGDLAFHHGGPSLQELIVPVLTVRTKVRELAQPSAGPIHVSGAPDLITNRIFSVALTLGEKQMILGVPGIVVRPLLMSAGKPVGAVGMAVDADFDRATGCVKLEPNKPITVAFLLNDENATSLCVVILDPSTDAELYRSPTDLPVRLGM